MDDKRRLAVTVIIETVDPRLFPERLDVASSEATHALSDAVLAHLSLGKPVAWVMDEEDAQLMHITYVYAAKQAGLEAPIRIAALDDQRRMLEACLQHGVHAARPSHDVQIAYLGHDVNTSPFLPAA